MTKSKNIKPVSLTQIRNLLKDKVFNPKVEPHNILADIRNLDYYEAHAKVLIGRAGDWRKTSTQVGSVEYVKGYKDYIKQTIRLLLLAEALFDEKFPTEKLQKGTGSKSSRKDKK